MRRVNNLDIRCILGFHKWHYTDDNLISRPIVAELMQQVHDKSLSIEDYLRKMQIIEKIVDATFPNITRGCRRCDKVQGRSPSLGLNFWHPFAIGWTLSKWLKHRENWMRYRIADTYEDKHKYLELAKT